MLFAVGGGEKALAHGLDPLTAALLGATLAVIGTRLDLPLVPTVIVFALACFALRIAAIRYGWRLPAALSPGDHPDDGTR